MYRRTCSAPPLYSPHNHHLKEASHRAEDGAAMKITFVRPNMGDFRSSDAMEPLAFAILALRARTKR